MFRNVSLRFNAFKLNFVGNNATFDFYFFYGQSSAQFEGFLIASKEKNFLQFYSCSLKFIKNSIPATQHSLSSNKILFWWKICFVSYEKKAFKDALWKPSTNKTVSLYDHV